MSAELSAQLAATGIHAAAPAVGAAAAFNDDAALPAVTMPAAAGAAPAVCRWHLMPPGERYQRRADGLCPCGCGGSAPPPFADWYGSRHPDGDFRGAMIIDGRVIGRQCGRWRGNTSVDYRYLPEDAPLHVPRAELSAGQRQLLLPNSSCYIGAVDADSRRQGQGIQHRANGDKLTGSWQQGKMQGPGSMQFADGDRYEGSFKDGMADGVGHFKWTDGRAYEGGFSAGKMHGFGVLRRKDGKLIFCGVWEKGEPKKSPVPLSALPADTTLVPVEAHRELANSPAGRELFVMPSGHFRVCVAHDGKPRDGAVVEFDDTGGLLARGAMTGGNFVGRRRELQSGWIRESEWEFGDEHGFFLLWDPIDQSIGRFTHGYISHSNHTVRQIKCLVPRSALLSSFDELPDQVKPAVAPADHEVLRMADGSIHVGVVKGGQPCGPGSRIYVSNCDNDLESRVMSGEAWRGDQLAEGKVQWFPSEDEYTGQLRDGLPHGTGIMIDDVYFNSHVGEFSFGKLVMGVEHDWDNNLIAVGRWDDEGVHHAEAVPVSILSHLSDEAKLQLGIRQTRGYAHRRMRASAVNAESTLLLPPGYTDGACSYAGQLNRKNEPHGRGSTRAATGRPIKGQCGEWRKGELMRGLYVLLIGNNDDSGSKLRGSVRDVKRLKIEFERLGFFVVLRRNRTEAEMKQDIAAFVASLTPGCVAWLHFSGHGYTEKGIEYLKPVDMRVHKADASSPLCRRNIMGALSAAGGKKGLYIMTLDGCRGDEEMEKSEIVEDSSASEDEGPDESWDLSSESDSSSSDEEADKSAAAAGKAKTVSPQPVKLTKVELDERFRIAQGRQFITGSACAEGHVAFEERNKTRDPPMKSHGVYTRYLRIVLEKLKAGEHSSISRVFQRFNAMCARYKYRKQNPTYSSTLGNDADWELLPLPLPDEPDHASIAQPQPIAAQSSALPDASQSSAVPIVDASQQHEHEEMLPELQPSPAVDGLKDASQQPPATASPPLPDEPDAQAQPSSPPSLSQAVHIHVQCDGCGEEPLLGTRFRCAHLQCTRARKQGGGFDLCRTCYEKPTNLEGHRHKGAFVAHEQPMTTSAAKEARLSSPSPSPVAQTNRSSRRSAKAAGAAPMDVD